MKILIIGGTGQISTPITRMLLARGHQVTLFNRGKSEIESFTGVRRIHGDRRDYPAFEEKMSQAGDFDCVIDMVAFVPDDIRSVVRTFKNNTRQYIFCSTAAAYQRPASRYPIKEVEPLRAISQYGQDKAHCEGLLMAAHQRGDFAVTILRPAATYGPGGDLPYTLGWGNRFLDRIRKGRPLVLPGDGSALRVYCHVDDVARAFVNAVGNRKAYGQAYHMTGEEWLTWRRYFELIAQSMESQTPRLVGVPSDLLARIAPRYGQTCLENFQYNNIFDNSKASRDLDFRYTIPFLAGIRETIRWLDDNGRIQDSDEEPLDDDIIEAWDETGQALEERMQN